VACPVGGRWQIMPVQDEHPWRGDRLQALQIDLTDRLLGILAQYEAGCLQQFLARVTNNVALGIDRPGQHAQLAQIGSAADDGCDRYQPRDITAMGRRESPEGDAQADTRDTDTIHLRRGPQLVGGLLDTVDPCGQPGRLEVMSGRVPRARVVEAQRRYASPGSPLGEVPDGPVGADSFVSKGVADQQPERMGRVGGPMEPSEQRRVMTSEITWASAAALLLLTGFAAGGDGNRGGSGRCGMDCNDWRPLFYL
jgi:hypothetical protein